MKIASRSAGIGLTSHTVAASPSPFDGGKASNPKARCASMLRSKSPCSEPTCPWRRSCQHEGFGVVELLITISIIGILTAISIPNILGQLPKYRLNGAARQVMGELIAARMKAVSQNKNVKVFFVNSHEYKVCDDANNDGIVDADEGSVRTRDLQTDYSDVELTATSNPEFNARGASTQLTTITLTNSYGSKNITVNVAGHVKIN